MTDRNTTVQNGQGIVPSIEITEYDESAMASTPNTRNVNRPDNDRNASRRRFRQTGSCWRKTPFAVHMKMILLTFIPHILFGSTMLVLGYVSWEIRNNNAATNDATQTEATDALFRRGKLGFHPMILADIFPISCIGVGLEFLFSGVSGFLTAQQKLKEYVQCHILWLSLSMLSALLLIAACSFGLRETRNITQGMTACIYIAIATCIAEVLCIVYNFYVVTYHLKNCSGKEKHPAMNSDLTSGGGTQEPASRPDQTEVSQSHVPNNRANPVRISPTLNGRIANRRLATPQGYHGRRRRSGQAGPLRMHLLHPGMNPSGGRNRLRRRPILRAQNHYVSTPIAYGRPRATSRSRNQSNNNNPNRRIVGEVPMFVIANHNRYVRQLNQSMENLESTANRGSVPGDVFPIINAVEGRTTTPKAVLQKSKSVDVVSTNQNITPAFLRANTLRDKVCQDFLEQRVEANPVGKDHKKPEDAQPISQRRILRDNLGYSVVMKTKRPEYGPKRLLKHVRSVDDEVRQNRLHHEKRNFSVSAMEDAVFNEVERGNRQRRHRFICPARTDEVTQKLSNTTNMPSKLKGGYTASEGDFSIIPYSDIAKQRRRNHQTSVSSDSNISRTESEARISSNHSPNGSHSGGALEMKEIARSDFKLSPVSNTTPSYENVNDPSTEVPRKFKF